jgi:signal peptidase complex subunit 3
MSFVFNPTLVLLLGIYILSYLVIKEIPKADLKIAGYQTRGKHDTIIFEPNLDLESEFRTYFNLKQIFVYLKATYTGKKNHSEIVWSKIIGRGDLKKLVGEFRSNYEIRGSILDDKVFELRGNYFPFVGAVKDFLFGRVS